MRHSSSVTAGVPVGAREESELESSAAPRSRLSVVPTFPTFTRSSVPATCHWNSVNRAALVTHSAGRPWYKR